MAAVFLRGVGIVGHRPEESEAAGDVKAEMEGRNSDVEEDRESQVTAR